MIKFHCLLGPGPLKEWVTFKGEGDQPPIIRIAPPLTGLHYEGTRKRRRAAIGDYAWSVGDRVDAWVQERCAHLLYSVSLAICCIYEAWIRLFGLHIHTCYVAGTDTPDMPQEYAKIHQVS